MHPSVNLAAIVTVIAGLAAVYVIFLSNRASERHLEQRLASLQATLHHSSIALHEYQKFKAAFNDSYDGMVITDANGIILFMNKSAARITGYTRSEMLGLKAERIWGNAMPKSWQHQLWHRIHHDRKPFLGQLKNKRKDGHEYDASISITPIYTAESKDHVAFYVSVERDLGQGELP